MPVDLLEEILEARAFAGAYTVWSTAKNKADVPDTPMMQLVKTIEFELAQQEIDRRRAQNSDNP